MPEPSLRSQDILVLAKLLAYAGPRPSMADIANALGISSSEVHGALKRLTRTRLVADDGPKSRPIAENVEEFLVYGIKYVFPVSRGGPATGLLTSHAVLSPSREASRGADLPPVWPFPDGHDYGLALEPLYRTAPAAAERDPVLYEILAVIDVLRDPDRKTSSIDMRSMLRGRS